MTEPTPADRYCRQTAFAPLGTDGQAALGRARAVLIGAGGLGSWIAELLARAGVGHLRLVDDDRVDWTNLHRQAMYDQADAQARTPKVLAAARRLASANDTVRVEPVQQRVSGANIAALADGADVILDGTDNFASRFILNDYAVQAGVPWVFAGVVGCEGQTATFLPGRPCLRCLYPQPPDTDITARQVGVLPPAVATFAALLAGEAIKILAGRADLASPYLLKLNLWTNTVQRLDLVAAAAEIDCPCCKNRRFEFLRQH